MLLIHSVDPGEENQEAKRILLMKMTKSIFSFVLEAGF